MIRFETLLRTDGKGYWSTLSKDVIVTKLGLGYINDEEDFGELCVYFDRDSWNVSKDGLIYTDRQWLSELRAKLNEVGFAGDDVDYSEQGMQGNNYVSLDVGGKFLSSWFNVVDKVDV